MVPSSSSSFSLPSSSSEKKTTTKFPRIQKTTLFKKPNFSSSMSLIKRRETIFKKAKELSILCDIEVCVICYEPNGDLHTWPENREKVKRMAERYCELSETKRRKASVNLAEFLEKMSKDGSKKKKLNLGSNSKFPNWDPTIYGDSVEKITELHQYMEQHCTRLQQRFQTVFEAKEQRNKNMAYQVMNHHQQQSNQVSNYNYGNNGTLSQIPVSTSALDQEQSLALIPSQLPMYPNLNVGDHSGLLPPQDPCGFNEFQNPNMSFNFNYNNVGDHSGLLPAQDPCWFNQFQNPNMNFNFNYNNVGDHSGLLPAQDPWFNEFQNPNMSTNVCMTYGYNDNSNTNGLSHQLVQYPTQTPTTPCFQFGSFNNNYSVSL